MTDKVTASGELAKKSAAASSAPRALLGAASGLLGAAGPAASGGGERQGAPGLLPGFNFGKIPIQTKLTVGSESDPLEEDADRTADRVMRTADPAPATKGDLQAAPQAPPGLAQRVTAEHAGEEPVEEPDEDEKELKRERREMHRKAAGGVAGTEAPPIVHEVLRSAGQPLDAGTRAYMEPRFGFDFGAVRVHADARAGESAQAVHALAYTVGHDAVFAPGRYAPGTTDGRRLLAHELAHVVQQGGSVARAQRDVLRRDENPAPAPAPPAPAVKKAGLRAAPNGDFEFQGDLLVASRAWLMTRFPRLEAEQKKPKIQVPELTRWVFGQYKAQGILAWADDKVLDAAAQDHRVFFGGPLGADPGTELPLHHSALRHIGPPPESLIKCQRVGSSYYIVVDFKTFQGSSHWVGSQVTPNRSLRDRILAALEADVGMKIDEKLRQEELNRPAAENDGWSLQPLTNVLAATWNFPPEGGAYFFGKKRWDDFLKTGAASGKGKQEQIGGVPLGRGISKEDRAFLEKFLKELNLPPAPDKGDKDKQANPISSYEISLLRKIDAHPLKAQLLERMRQAHGKGGNKDAPSVLTAKEIDDLIAQVDLETANKTLKMPERKPGGEAPLTHSRLTGQIINRSGLLTDKKDKAEFYFKVTNTDVVFAVPWVHIDWRAYSAKRNEDDPKRFVPDQLVQSDESRRFIYRQPDDERFDADKILRQPGIYQIHAFVDHSFFLPAHFEIPVQVQPERKHIAEMETEAGYGDMKWKKKSFGTGFDANTEGFEGTGDLPAEWRRTFASRTRFQEKDRERLTKLVEHYQKAGQGGEANADIVKYATEALKRLDETKALIGGEAARGFHSFEARGVYATRETGMKEGSLTLVGMAKKLPNGKVEVHLHDLSKIWEQVDYHFHGTEDTFDKALQEAYYDLAKAYPPGRVSVAFEELDPKGEKSTGKRLGFELSTGTAWKSVKGVLFSTPVQILVNLAGTAVMVFFPVSAPLVMGVLAAYNAVNTIDSMVDLESKGLLTKKEIAKGVAMIGMDLLPFVGRAKVFAKSVRATFMVIEGIQLAGMMVIMTDTGVEQLGHLRDGQIKQIADLDEEIQKMNPAHPDLKAKKRELELLIAETRAAGVKMFTEMAAQGLIMLAPSVVFGKMTEKVMKAKLADLHAMRLFEHAPGVKEPRYDPATGKFHIDMENHLQELSITQLDRLKKTFATDMSTKTEQLAKLLGVPPEKVEFVRGAKTQVEPAADGGFKVTIGEGQTMADTMEAAWKNRLERDPHATRPDATPPRFRPTFSGADIKTKQNIMVGNALPNDQAAAHEVMRKVSGGDPEGFRALGVELPEGFDPRAVEWGLGQLPDGSFVVIRGYERAVDWGPFPGVKPVAHSHPLYPGKYLAGEPKNLHIGEVMRGEKGNDVNRRNLAPSAADVAFCARNNIEGHVVHTPYVDKGHGVVGNPTEGLHEPRIDIEIHKPERVGSFFGNDEIPIYQCEMVARAGGKEIWRGPVWTVDYPGIGSLLEAKPFAGAEAGFKGAAPKAEPKGAAPKGKGPGTTKAGEKGPRVQSMVEGVYDAAPKGNRSAHKNVDGGTVVVDHMTPIPPDKDGWEVHTAAVQYTPPEVNGVKGTPVEGYVERAFRRRPDGTVEMELRQINLAGFPPMLDDIANPMMSTGTPTALWVQTQQMKNFGVKTGQVSRATIKDVENLKAICQITVDLQKLGLPPTAANVSKVMVDNLSYFGYAETLLTQTGHTVTGAQVVGGKVVPLGEVVQQFTGRPGDPNSGSTPQGAALAKELQTRYNLSSDTPVLSGFDVVLDTAPREGAKP